jgi:hypothetical protein
MQTEQIPQSLVQQKVKNSGVQSKAVGSGTEGPAHFKEGWGGDAQPYLSEPTSYEGDGPKLLGSEERDPYGIDPKSSGAKLDAGKPCLWRGAVDYFPGALRAVAAVSTFGATKYSWKGWSTVPEGFERYSDAMVRHLVAESAEGPWDNDSGILHAAHAAWNSLARLEFLLREKSLSATGEK